MFITIEKVTLVIDGCGLCWVCGATILLSYMMSLSSHYHPIYWLHGRGKTRGNRKKQTNNTNNYKLYDVFLIYIESSLHLCFVILSVGYYCVWSERAAGPRHEEENK